MPRVTQTKNGRTKPLTPSTRQKRSVVSKLTTQPSAPSARRKYAVWGLVILFSGILMPHVDRAYLNWRAPERVQVAEAFASMQFMEDRFCKSIRHGQLLLADVPVCDVTCTAAQRQDYLSLMMAHDFVGTVCQDHLSLPRPDPNQVAETFIGMK